MKVLTIIPAYNEQHCIGTVIKRIRQNIPQTDILVVNDGSRDATSAAARNEGVQVVDLPFNLGIGGAMQTGYLFAQRNDYDVAVQVDGDGQHNPAYISDLITPIVDGRADMVIGSRYVLRSGYRSPLLRRTGMVFFSSLVGFLIGQQIKDTTSGFRAVSRQVIGYFAEYYPTDYPEVDVLIKLHKRNYRILELPVKMNEREGGKSSITPLRSVYYMIKVSLSLLMGKIKHSEEYGGEAG